jgi:hypothetical protein|tara:strand:+ start:916 stop:1512 length:597 start_codon:yes stop_codon:yes gene_type:complete
MALPSSGTLSFQDITIEARGVSYGSMNNQALSDVTHRNLAGKNQYQTISLSDFHGKEGGVDRQTMYVQRKGTTSEYGYGDNSYYWGLMGSLSDNTCNFRNNTNRYYWVKRRSLSWGRTEISIAIQGRSYGNTGFNSMEIRPTSITGYPNVPHAYLLRTDATYSSSSYFNYSSWKWILSASKDDPIGQSAGALRFVIFR